MSTTNGTNTIAAVTESDARSAVVTLLAYIGEDPVRDGLTDTPARVVKALTEMTAGRDAKPGDLLATTFDLGSHAAADELVILTAIPFHSLCEHHLLPFSGTATVAYLPAGSRVVGLSKLARLVDLFARRLQVQERLTTQVAQALMDHAGARGAACIVTGTHHCMCARGVRVEGRMVTSSLLGVLRENPEARAELMALHS